MHAKPGRSNQGDPHPYNGTPRISPEICVNVPALATLRNPGVLAALAAAALFGVGTPLAKLIMERVDPWMLAGLLYLGSGLGLFAYRVVRQSPAVRLPGGEWRWLCVAVLSGGVLAPVLLMLGLSRMAASSAALLLNFEGVFTALLAWFVFHENMDRRVALGMLAIVGGGVVLSWQGEHAAEPLIPTVCVVGACMAWAIDNNFTRKVSLSDPTWIAAVKGLVAGIANVVLALLLGASPPPLGTGTGAMVVGFFAYGLSLTLFRPRITARRHGKDGGLLLHGAVSRRRRLGSAAFRADYHPAPRFRNAHGAGCVAASDRATCPRAYARGNRARP